MSVIPSSRGNPQASDIAVETALPMIGSASREDLQATLDLTDAELSKLFEDRNALLSGGGIITNNSTGTSLSFTTAFTLYFNSNVAGASPYAVSISSSPWAFSADGRMAYVTVNRTGASGTLTTDSATLPAVTSSEQEIFLIAKRVGTAILLYNGQSIAAGTSAPLGRPGGVLDTEFSVQDSTDPTKQIVLDAAGTTGTKTTLLGSQTSNRILTLPDATDTLVGRATTETLSNKTLPYLRQQSADDSTSTGSTATISNGITPATGIIRITNASLTGVSGIQSANSGQQLIIENKTGNSVLFNNEDGVASAANRIQTGTGGGISLADDASLLFVYDSSQLRWQLVGGTGSGGGSGSGKNYLSSVTTSQSSTPNTGNGNFELGSTAGWSLGTVGTLTNGIPTGTPTFGSGASGNLNISVVSSSHLAGLYSLSYASSAATTQGNMLASDAFYIDSEDQAKVLTWKFYYKAQTNPSNADWSGTSSNSFGVAVYDVTNSAWLPVAGQFSMTQNSGIGLSVGTFQTAINTTSLRLVVYNVNATSGAITLYFDDFSVGPQITNVGPVVTDWQSFTPTGSWTTNTTYTGMWRRLGDSMEVIFKASLSGAPNNTSLTINIPSGYTIDSAKVPSATNVGGYIGRGGGAAAAASRDFYIGYSSTTAVFVGYVSSTSAQLSSFSTTLPATWASGDYVNGRFLVPIVGWSSNVQVSNDTDTRVATAKLIGTTGASYTSGNTTIIPYNSKAFDTHNTADTSTGRITVPVSGYYEVAGGISVNGGTTTNGNAYQLMAYVNGSLAQGVSIYNGRGVAEPVYLIGKTVLKLNAGDIVDLRFSGTFASGSLAFGSSSTAQNQFFIERLSGPSVIAATESVNCHYNTAAGQSISNSGSDIVNFDTKVYDSHNAVTTGAGWIFTAPVSGKYKVTSTLVYASASFAALTQMYVDLYKNGSAALRLGGTVVDTTTTQPRIHSGSGTINMSAGDTLNVRAFQNSGGAKSLLNSAVQVWIQVERVGN